MRIVSVRRLVAISLAIMAASASLTGCSAGGLTAPARFGDWITDREWAKNFNDPQAEKNAEDAAERRVNDTAAISAAYGAAAATDLYVRGDYQEFLPMRMVATQAPAYFVSAVDLDYAIVSGISPSEEVQTFGNVECRVQHPNMLNEESLDNVWTECMRRSADLTLWLGPKAIMPSDLAESTDLAWKATGGTEDPPTLYTFSDSDGRSSRPILAPDEVGGYGHKEAAVGWSNVADRLASYKAADEASLTAIYGVASLAQTYASQDSGNGFTIFAIRTDTPAPFVAYEDLKFLRIIAPRNQVVEIEGVQCEVRNNAVPAGSSVDELDPEVQWCQRSDDGLTVWLAKPFGDTRGNVEQAAALVNAVFETSAI